ncbi:conjugal transfer protein TrbL family protein [Nonomuraea sp. NPDC059194]|uniref:conjugal transfer protein TrbL family protein n=1 Tax=Nonomuraea sp. NPDC059194 TaxID=3346764 RepID=UPI0036744887
MRTRLAAAAIVVATATLVLAAEAAAAVPAPNPSPTPSPSPSGPASELDWGPARPSVGIGIGDWITGQINAWFGNLVAMSIRPLLDILASSLLATPDVSASGRVFDLWKATAAIANGAFLVLATIGAIAAMGYQTVQTRYAVKEVLPRLGLAILAANLSFLICGKIIEVSNALSGALLGQDFDAKRAATSIRMMILPPSNNQIFYILLALVAIILLILLVITFIMRSALVLLLVVASPLAMACHSLPHTDGVARFWWRAFTGLLLIQVAQSLTLVLAMRVFFNQDGRLLLGIEPTGQLINFTLAICLLVILVRIPSWIFRQIFIQGGRGSTITRIIKYAIAAKATAPVLNALRLGRGGTGGGAPSKRATALTMTSKVVAGAIGGPACTAASTAITASTAARSGANSFKHAPTGARRPIRAEDWEPAPVKHAPTAPPVAGKYRPTPKPQEPIRPTTPVYGYPRESFYANGPAGLGQMNALRSNSRLAIEPPRTGQSPVRPIVPPDAPIPSQANWPENPGARRTPRPRPRPRKPRGGDSK